MKRFQILFLAIAIAALGLLAGCGGDDDGDESGATDQTEQTTEQASDDQFSQELAAIDREVSQAFGRVFESGAARLDPDERVPQEVKDALANAAEVERNAVERLEELDAPEDAQDAVDGLAAEASEQADALAEAAEDENLTARELEQAFSEQNPEQYLNELEELGYLPGNDADEGESGAQGGGERGERDDDSRERDDDRGGRDDGNRERDDDNGGGGY